VWGALKARAHQASAGAHDRRAPCLRCRIAAPHSRLPMAAVRARCHRTRLQPDRQSTFRSLRTLHQRQTGKGCRTWRWRRSTMSRIVPRRRVLESVLESVLELAVTAVVMLQGEESIGCTTHWTPHSGTLRCSTLGRHTLDHHISPKLPHRLGCLASGPAVAGWLKGSLGSVAEV
jgi:hypothetical protein